MGNTDSAVWNAFMELQTALQSGRPEDRSPKARAYAVTLTEVEKALAYFHVFVLQPAMLQDQVDNYAKGEKE